MDTSLFSWWGLAGGEPMKREQINKVISYNDKEWEENETGILIVRGGGSHFGGQGRPC